MLVQTIHALSIHTKYAIRIYKDLEEMKKVGSAKNRSSSCLGLTRILIVGVQVLRTTSLNNQYCISS